MVLPVKIGPTLPARGAADLLRWQSTPGRVPRVLILPVLPSCGDLRDSAREAVATVTRRADIAARSVIMVVPIATILPDVPTRASGF